MIRSAHTGLSLATRVIEHVDVLRHIRGRGPGDYEKSEEIATGAPPVAEMARRDASDLSEGSSSTEEYSHWEGDSVWRKSLSRHSSRSSDSSGDTASGPYENI